jgi:hypothetical protein
MASESFVNEKMMPSLGDVSATGLVSGLLGHRRESTAPVVV